MEWWQAAILGVVEGITEYLPVSSTGHLLIASSLMGLAGEAVDTFDIVIQGGAILAVLGLYRARVVQMLRGLMGHDAAGLKLLINLVIAFVPAAVLGVVVHGWVKEHLFHPGPVVGALVVGGVYMIGVDLWRQGRLGGGAALRQRTRDRGVEDLTAAEALVIGLMQCVSLWPGTSRSMMTITAGFIVGLRATAAAEFSFLLGAMTLGAATVYELARDVMGHGQAGYVSMFSLGTGAVVIGVVVAAVAAAVSVKWLVAYLNRHGLIGFGWYRILLGLAMVGLILGGVVKF